MKKTGIAAILLFSMACNQSSSAKVEEAPKPAVAWIGKWFAAWELISDHIFHLPHDAAPEFLFFDETNVYTTSKISASGDSTFDGPKLFNESLQWRVAKHNDTLTLPDAQKVPVGLMTFAARGENGRVFFVMAAPSYWAKAGIESKELSLEKLLTGVFLHEFAHTRQFKGMGGMVDSIEHHQEFKEVPLTDDIVQGYFKKDSGYVKEFNKEVATFYQAVFATNDDDTKRLTREALTLLKARQAKYFVNDKAILKQLDDVFLSMEGLGQFVAVSWLIDRAGGNMNFDIAVEGFRRKRTQWSQEEGLAMYLILNKLARPNWQDDIFNSKSNTITDLLEKFSK